MCQPDKIKCYSNDTNLHLYYIKYHHNVIKCQPCGMKWFYNIKYHPDGIKYRPRDINCYLDSHEVASSYIMMNIKEAFLWRQVAFGVMKGHPGGIRWHFNDIKDLPNINMCYLVTSSVILMTSSIIIMSSNVIPAASRSILITSSFIPLLSQSILIASSIVLVAS